MDRYIYRSSHGSYYGIFWKLCLLLVSLNIFFLGWVFVLHVLQPFFLKSNSLKQRGGGWTNPHLVQVISPGARQLHEDWIGGGWTFDMFLDSYNLRNYKKFIEKNEGIMKFMNHDMYLDFGFSDNVRERYFKKKLPPLGWLNGYLE